MTFLELCQDQVEIYHEICSFLPVKDITNQTYLSKQFYRLLISNHLWSLLCYRDILPTQFPKEITSLDSFGQNEFINNLYKVLHICYLPGMDFCPTMERLIIPVHPSPSKQLYRALYSFRHRLIGYYRRIPTRDQSQWEHRGGFLALFIDRKTNSLMFQSIDYNGSPTEQDVVPLVPGVNHAVKVVVLNGYLAFGDYRHEDRYISPIVGTNRSGELLIKCRRQDSAITLRKLLPTINPPPEISTRAWLQGIDIRHLEPCLGLVKAMYGPHGMELLHVMLQQPIQNHEFGDTINHGGLIQLHGLKLIGDPNVPANQLSFSVDICNQISPSIAIEQDNRPCISFDNSVGIPIIFSVSTRCNNILTWCRGFGQINRSQSSWQPEWVSINFLVYKVPIHTPNGYIRFSVLFDDDDHIYRHIIDYISVRFPLSSHSSTCPSAAEITHV